MDIELVTDPYACMMYIVSPLAGLGGAYCGGLPPTAYFFNFLNFLELHIINSLNFTTMLPISDPQQSCTVSKIQRDVGRTCEFSYSRVLNALLKG